MCPVKEPQTSALCTPRKFKEKQNTNISTSGKMEALLAVERFSGEAQVNATFLLDSHVVKCGDESMYGLDTGA